MAGETILIVDDNPMNMKLIGVLLQSEGYEIRTAAPAAQAQSVRQQFRPRLILMNIQLPGIDGLELTRRLKAAPVTRPIPIIGLSAYAMKGDEECILAAGCDGYIPKPIDTRTLPAVIRNCLDRLSLDAGAGA